MHLTKDQRAVLTVLSSKRYVPLYEIMRLNQANYRARISELRDKGFDIPKPAIKKNQHGNIMSTYSMSYEERMRARKELRNGNK